jgi:hypothetical protein
MLMLEPVSSLRRNGNEPGLGMVGRQYDLFFFAAGNYGCFLFLFGCLNLFLFILSYVKHTPFQRRSC